MDITNAVFVYFALCLIACLLEESLSYSAFALGVWQYIFAGAFGYAIKWAWDLAMLQEWGQFIVIGCTVLVVIYALYRTNQRKRSIESRINERTIDWMESWFKYLDKSIKQDRELLKQILAELKDLNTKIGTNNKPKE